MVGRKPKLERNLKIKELRAKGWTLQQIADAQTPPITRQAVRAILLRTQKRVNDLSTVEVAGDL